MGMGGGKDVWWVWCSVSMGSGEEGDKVGRWGARVGEKNMLTTQKIENEGNIQRYC